jgi:hypothetical protein
MAVSYVGITLIVIMLIVIILLVITGFSYRTELTQCQTQQNSSCFQIHCPCDNNTGPCLGYTKRPGPVTGQWYCSNAPLTLVDNNGKQIQ